MPTTTVEVQEMLPTEEWLTAEVLGVEERESTFEDQSTYWNWKFGVELPDGRKRVLYDSTPAQATTKNKCGRWLAAVRGVRVDQLDGSIDTDDLVGACLQVLLDVKTRTDGSEKNVVARVRPMPAAVTGPAPARGYGEIFGEQAS